VQTSGSCFRSYRDGLSSCLSASTGLHSVASPPDTASERRGEAGGAGHLLRGKPFKRRQRGALAIQPARAVVCTGNRPGRSCSVSRVAHSSEIPLPAAQPQPASALSTHAQTLVRAWPHTRTRTHTHVQTQTRARAHTHTHTLFSPGRLAFRASNACDLGLGSMQWARNAPTPVPVSLAASHLTAVFCLATSVLSLQERDADVAHCQPDSMAAVTISVPRKGEAIIMPGLGHQPRSWLSC
jgi:hypothetical protein